MDDEQTLPSAENLGDVSEAVEQTDAGATDKPAEVVPGSEVETDEQKNQRVAAEAAEKAAQRRARDQQSINQRMAELTAEKKAAQEMAAQAMALLQRGQQPQTQVSGAPVREQFESWEDFIAANATYKATNEVRQLFEQQSRQQAEQRQAEDQQRQARDQAQQFQRRAAELAKELPDFAAVMANADMVQVPDHVAAALRQREDGPRIAYHMVKNPALAQAMQGLDAMSQLVMLGELSASLRTAPKVSNAAPPGRPTGASKASSLGDPPEDTEAYFAWAEKQKM